jgi:hypothetical protein
MGQAAHNKIVSFIWGIAALRGLLEAPSVDILAIEKEAEKLLDGLLVQGTPA